MGAMASQIAKLTIVYWTVYSGADQRKHQSSASLAFVRGIHRWPVNYPHTWPVTRKMFPFNDVIMSWSVQHRGIFHRAIWRWDTIKVRKIWMICHAENGAKYILYFWRKNLLTYDTTGRTNCRSWHYFYCHLPIHYGQFALKKQCQMRLFLRHITCIADNKSFLSYFLFVSSQMQTGQNTECQILWWNIVWKNFEWQTSPSKGSFISNCHCDARLCYKIGIYVFWCPILWPSYSLHARPPDVTGTSASEVILVIMGKKHITKHNKARTIYTGLELSRNFCLQDTASAFNFVTGSES